MCDTAYLDTLASHHSIAAREARTITVKAEQRKRIKYAHLSHFHHYSSGHSRIGAFLNRHSDTFKNIQLTRSVSTTVSEPRYTKLLFNGWPLLSTLAMQHLFWVLTWDRGFYL